MKNKQNHNIQALQGRNYQCGYITPLQGFLKWLLLNDGLHPTLIYFALSGLKYDSLKHPTKENNLILY
jgi:hypothetical protein